MLFSYSCLSQMHWPLIIQLELRKSTINRAISDEKLWTTDNVIGKISIKVTSFGKHHRRVAAQPTGEVNREWKNSIPRRYETPSPINKNCQVQIVNVFYAHSHWKCLGKSKLTKGPLVWPHGGDIRSWLPLLKCSVILLQKRRLAQVAKVLRATCPYVGWCRDDVDTQNRLLLCCSGGVQ